MSEPNERQRRCIALAQRISDLLGSESPERNFVGGSLEETHIDGCFNLLSVAAALLADSQGIA